MKKILIIIYACLLLISGCSIHKLDVQQGNVITPDMIAKLKVGMNMDRVRYLLGSPPITDPFHQNRWDYTYTYRERDQQVETSHLTLTFDQAGNLAEIDQSGYIEPKERSGKLQ